MIYKQINEFKTRAKEFIPDERLIIIDYDPLMRSQGYQEIEKIITDEYKSAILVAHTVSIEEISKLLQLSQELAIPISVRQATGSNTPDIPRTEVLGSVVIDLRLMKSIKIDIENGYVEVGPAVTFIELNKYLSSYGYSYPPSVPPVRWHSLVGLNTSGQLTEAYNGKPGDYVIGMQVVLPDGEIIETGSKILRKPCGPDLTRLFIGGQSLFGIITMLRLMLVRKPREMVQGIVIFDSIRELGDAVSGTYRAGTPFARIFDFMDDRYLQLLGVYEDFRGSLLMLEVEGDAPGSASWKLNTIFDFLREKGAKNSRVMDQSEWEHLSVIRYGHQNYLKKQNRLLLMGEVIDCQVSKLTEILLETRQIQDDFCKQIEGLGAYFFGHIGALSFHPAFSAPVEWPYEKYKNISRDIRKKLVDIKIKHEASVSEQGIFPQHKDWFLQMYGNNNYKLLCDIKSVFDPKDLYNSGRL